MRITRQRPIADGKARVTTCDLNGRLLVVTVAPSLVGSDLVERLLAHAMESTSPPVKALRSVSRANTESGDTP